METLRNRQTWGASVYQDVPDGPKHAAIIQLQREHGAQAAFRNSDEDHRNLARVRREHGEVCPLSYLTGSAPRAVRPETRILQHAGEKPDLDNRGVA
eukprot:2127825-Rhodomonas_salina.1